MTADIRELHMTSSFQGSLQTTECAEQKLVSYRTNADVPWAAGCGAEPGPVHDRDAANLDRKADKRRYVCQPH
jgi:hypothetical protein